MKVETIFERLLFSTVRIETTTHDGSKLGTGFFFAHHTEEGEVVLFLVTNKHVVENGTGGYITLTKEDFDGSPIIGHGLRLDIDSNSWNKDWFGHPDADVDIALIPLVPLLKRAKRQYGFRAYSYYIDKFITPEPQHIRMFNALESVLFIGYPNGLWDDKNLIPIMRKGFTATPLQLDFEGEPKFLIDASVFGGSSGSPVFLADHGSFMGRDGKIYEGSRLFFLGVVAEVYEKTEFNELVPRPIPSHIGVGVEVNQTMNLGVVFKAITITETAVAYLSTLSDYQWIDIID